MHERYFYLANISGDLVSLFYSPKYKLEKITIASNDFVSDIEAFGEISKLMNDEYIANNYDINFNFNKKYFPNKEKLPKKIESLFDIWQEYSPEEVINAIAHITILKHGENIDSLTSDDDNVLSPLHINDGIEIKIYVISRKENLTELLEPTEATIH